MHPTALDTVVGVASGEAHPLLDIDGTVLIQFALFAVMFFVANKLLFQPYLKLRERRIAGIDGARAEADQMSAEADAKLADYESKLAAARARAAEEQRKVRADAAAHEREVTERGRQAAQKAMDEATARVKAETAAARKELTPQAEQIARGMVKRILGREVA
ncbi:MAG TPA: ATP synthase F0 subunit B [Kofleriaceae bacterium]|nr:ATP synthase F0 subunit B [Kofleriaceae bacterium]